MRGPRCPRVKTEGGGSAVHEAACLQEGVPATFAQVKPATMVVDAPLPDEIAQQLPPIFWCVSLRGVASRLCRRVYVFG